MNLGRNNTVTSKLRVVKWYPLQFQIPGISWVEIFLSDFNGFVLFRKGGGLQLQFD